jgi:hypothetical protein
MHGYVRTSGCVLKCVITAVLTLSHQDLTLREKERKSNHRVYQSCDSAVLITIQLFRQIYRAPFRQNKQQLLVGLGKIFVCFCRPMLVCCHVCPKNIASAVMGTTAIISFVSRFVYVAVLVEYYRPMHIICNTMA